MSKVLEELERLTEYFEPCEDEDDINPSEALEWLNKFKGVELSSLPFKSEDGAVKEVDLNEVRFVGSPLNNDFRKFVYIIENALIKAQEQEKVIIELCEYCGMDNLYPYDNLEEIEITFKDTFDNYQRQRIESLGRLNKQEKVLEIIFEKGLSLAERDIIKQSENYEQYQIKISWWNYKPFAIPKSKEEFDLLKRWTK